MKPLRTLAFAIAVAAGCGSSGGQPSPIDAAPSPDAPGQLTLVGFVSELIIDHTDDTSAPVTVADKQPVDTQDPTAFDSLLAQFGGKPSAPAAKAAAK